MAHISVNDKEVREALRIAPQRVIAGINKSLRRSAVYAQGAFRRNMPAGATGMLRKNTSFKFLNQITVRVEPNEKYADYVETGTKPHWAPVSSLERWAKLKGINPYALQRGIAKHGTKAHPYLDKSIKETESFAVKDMGEQLNQVIEEVL